jgi:hypothetical protein
MKGLVWIKYAYSTVERQFLSLLCRNPYIEFKSKGQRAHYNEDEGVEDHDGTQTRDEDKNSSKLTDLQVVQESVPSICVFKDRYAFSRSIASSPPMLYFPGMAKHRRRTCIVYQIAL